MEMIIYFMFTVFAFQVASSYDPNNEYCTVRGCPNGTHTMCRYTDVEPHDRCERIIRAGLNETERQRILFLHIFFRTRVFGGHERRGNPGPQPAANSNLFLEWDDELAEIAQRWAQQCMLFNDGCRNVERFPVGQNFILDDYDEDMDESLALTNLQELIESWYEEVVRFNRNLVESFGREEAYSTSTEHYTQMVWGNTTRLGCGAIRFHKIMYPVPKIFIVCNYGTSGNREGEPVYRIME